MLESCGGAKDPPQARLG